MINFDYEVSKEAKSYAESLYKYYHKDVSNEFVDEHKEKDLSYLIEKARCSLDEVRELKESEYLIAQEYCKEAIYCLGDVLAVMQWIIDEEYKED